MESGLISNIQRFSLHDGPGIRTTVFLKGCPLRCLWCHNPENLDPQPEVRFVANRCIACGQCEEKCPYGDEPERLRTEKCSTCGVCVSICPTAARQIVGRPMTVAELTAEVERDLLFFEESHGGVTFSGGEPLRQGEFLVAMLRRLRDLGIHTAVDTCGYTSAELLMEVASMADLILYDLKVVDAQKHRQLTGVSNEAILSNLQRLGRTRAHIWLRIPVIPGLNDTPADVAAAIDVAASVTGIRQVNLLAYHRLGSEKLGRLGQPGTLEPIAPPTPDHMQQIAEEFKARGIHAVIGG